MAARSNGSKTTLQEALALLVQNQALCVSQLAETHRLHNESNRRHDESNRRLEEANRRQEEANRRHDEMMLRLTALERDMEEIKTLLIELPEAVRQKIGFKTK